MNDQPAAVQPTQTTSPSPPLSLWRRVGYGLGDIYGGGASVVVSFYYLIFLTDVVRISPALAGTVILISKVYDAITDPFEGQLADRTRTRWGRRRPYLAAGVPLIFLSFVALFFPFSQSQELQRFAFVVLSYLFFSTVVSLVMLNYNALQSEITLDYHERSSLSSIRIFFSTVSSIVSALIPLEIVKLFPDVRDGYLAMGVFFGLFYALPMIITVLSVKERKEFQKPLQKFHWRQAFVEPFTVRTFVYALLMYLLTFVAMDAVSSIVVYYMKYYLGRGDEANYVTGVLLVAQVISLPFYILLSRRTSKRRAFIVGALIWAGAMLFSLALTPASPAYLVYVFATLVGFGTGGIVVMMYAIFPDIPDVDELVTGERREGTYSALITFVRKLSAALAIFAVSNAIGWAGYQAPLEESVAGVTTLVEQPQSELFILVLRLIFFAIPIVLLTLAVIVARRYPLSPQVHQRLNALLAHRRAGGEQTAAEQAEAAALIHELVR